MSVQSLFVMWRSPRHIATLFLAHLFALKWRLKSSEDKVVSEWERKVLPCFDVEIWGKNVKIANFSIRAPVQS